MTIQDLTIYPQAGALIPGDLQHAADDSSQRCPGGNSAHGGGSMSNRYRQFLDLANSQYDRAQAQQQAGDHHRSSASFDSAARFLHSALREFAPNIPDLPELDTPPVKLHRHIGQTEQLSAIADHHN